MDRLWRFWHDFLIVSFGVAGSVAKNRIDLYRAYRVIAYLGNRVCVSLYLMLWRELIAIFKRQQNHQAEQNGEADTPPLIKFVVA